MQISTPQQMHQQQQQQMQMAQAQAQQNDSQVCLSCCLEQDWSLIIQLQSLRRQQETEARKAYEKQLHQDQAMRSMQLQQQQQPNGSQAGTPFNPNPQTPLAVTHSLETLSPAQLASTNNGANQNPTQTQTTTATSSPRTTLISGSQQMQRNQSRTTGIGVGSGSMLPPQSPANRTTTPKPVGVGIGVGVGKATPKMMKEELVSRAVRQGLLVKKLIKQKDTTPKSLQPSPSNAIVHIADNVPTTSTHGLTPSPPTGSTVTPAEPTSDNPTLTVNPPPQEPGQPENQEPTALNITNMDMNMSMDGLDPNFSANDFTNADFLNTDFDFGAEPYDAGGFDFTMYLAEYGDAGDDVEVGIV
jgi:hypothetical protein